MKSLKIKEDEIEILYVYKDSEVISFDYGYVSKFAGGFGQLVDALLQEGLGLADLSFPERLLVKVKHVLDVCALGMMLKVEEHLFKVLCGWHHLNLLLLGLSESQNRLLLLCLLA